MDQLLSHYTIHSNPFTVQHLVNGIMAFPRSLTVPMREKLP